MNTDFEKLIDKVSRHYAKITLYLNNVPFGFNSHTLYCYLVALEDSGVAVLIPWSEGNLRLMRFMPHTVIAIEYEVEQFLDGVGIA